MKYNCQCCGKEFEYKTGKTASHKFCNSCRIIIRSRKLKNFFVQQKGGKCERCGYNKSLYALEFHHVDPATKEFNLRFYKMSKERLQTEINKCILVCSNCHREIHENLAIKYNEFIDDLETFDDILDKKNKKIQIKQYELENTKCKNLIDLGHFKQRKVVRPETYDDFKKELESFNNNKTAMGRKYGVTSNTIKKWERSYQKYGY